RDTDTRCALRAPFRRRGACSDARIDRAARQRRRARRGTTPRARRGSCGGWGRPGARAIPRRCTSTRGGAAPAPIPSLDDYCTIPPMLPSGSLLTAAAALALFSAFFYWRQNYRGQIGGAISVAKLLWLDY